VPPPDESEGDTSVAPDDAGTYGLVRLLDVPDGARVSLDGRYWLEAHDLAGQWFRVSPGRHTISVRASGSAPVEYEANVVAGQQQELRLGPLA
jgi:hypothetical protein